MLCIDKILICKIVCLFWIARAKSRNNVLILFLERCKKKMLMHDKFDFDWPQVDVTLDWLQSSSLSFEFVLPSLSKFIHYYQSASPSENKLALVWAGGTCKHKQKRRRRSEWPKIESAHVVRFMSASMEKILLRPSLVLGPWPAHSSNKPFSDNGYVGLPCTNTTGKSRTASTFLC